MKFKKKQKNKTKTKPKRNGVEVRIVVTLRQSSVEVVSRWHMRDFLAAGNTLLLVLNAALFTL